MQQLYAMTKGTKLPKLFGSPLHIKLTLIFISKNLQMLVEPLLGTT